MRVTVVGQGYVGLTASTGLAAAGHEVIGVERDPSRLDALRAGRAPVYEPGLEELLGRAMTEGRLDFLPRVCQVPGPVDAVIIAVATPPLVSGGADLRQAKAALRDVLAMPSCPSTVIMKSTVPPGTSGRWVRAMPAKARMRERYVYNPEFLNQGSSLSDWEHPSRVVVGMWDDRLLASMTELYHWITSPWVVAEPVDAEMIKYANNAGLATKISFINEIATLCDRLGADIDKVVEGVRHETRLGDSFWRPGVGYGDSCLPKDVAALIQCAMTHGQAAPLLAAVRAVNDAARIKPVRMVEEALATRASPSAVVAVLGLSYEPHSDDIRSAPSLVILPEILQLGVDVRAWDPLLDESTVAALFPDVTSTSIIGAVAGADVIVVLTEFADVCDADWEALAGVAQPGALVIDAKNHLDARALRRAGFDYRGIGRRLAPCPALPTEEPGDGPRGELLLASVRSGEK